MNFKTTIVLIALLAVAVGALWFTREKKAEEGGKIVEENKQKLFDIATNDVHKVVVTAADGKRMTLEKSNAKWRLSEPVNAPAEQFEVDNLVRAVADLESRGKVDSSSATAEATGLAKPRYVVDISTADGRTRTLNVGEKPAVGDIVYVARKDNPGETLVVAADLLEKLDKPASDYRDKKLIDVSTGDVRQITLEKPDGKIVISRVGQGDWKITEPKTMPAEKTEIDDILFGLTGLRATEFVSETSSDAALYGLDQPRIRATLATTQPITHTFVSTAPSTSPASQPMPLVINLGRPADVLKKDIYASTSASPVIAKVAASVIETVNKKPIELRDKRAVDIDPAQVSSITISSDIVATTRPTTKPASRKEVVIRRRKESDVKAQATTKPATQASTRATTAPATTQAVAATQPASKWEIVSGSTAKDAEDSRVDALLNSFHPFRAQKYLESAPTTQPAATYVIRVATVAPGGAQANHEIRLVDPGSNKPLNATYNDLAFEADRSVVDRLSGDFLKGSGPPPAAGAPSLGNDSDAAPFSPGP